MKDLTFESIHSDDTIAVVDQSTRATRYIHLDDEKIRGRERGYLTERIAREDDYRRRKEAEIAN